MWDLAYEIYIRDLPITGVYTRRSLRRITMVISRRHGQYPPSSLRSPLAPTISYN